MKGYKAGECVIVQTIGGPMPATVVDGRETRGGRVKVRIYYPAPITGGVFGAPRSFHVDDVARRRWPDRVP